MYNNYYGFSSNGNNLDIIKKYGIKEKVFDYIFKYGKDIPSSDKCFMNPIGLDSYILSIKPLSKVYIRNIRYGTTCLVSPKDQDLDNIVGVHFTITDNGNKTLYLGSLDICYCIIRMIIDKVIQPHFRDEGVGVIKNILRYTKPTCGFITACYIGNLSKINFTEMSDCDLLEFISEGVVKYHCEFTEVGINIFNELSNISKLMVS